MTRRTAYTGAGFVGLAVLLGGLTAAPVLSRVVRAQDEGRQLWDSEFLKKRPPATATSRPEPPPTYRRATAPVPEPRTDNSNPEVIGITIWRLRPTTAADGRDSRLLLQDDGGAAEWAPERVEAQTIFKAGDRLKLSIESSRPGYLYVIDREEYGDGSTSDPYLIFPTLRIHAGNNSVVAGKVVELPENSAFRLRPMRSDYRGEQLTVVVTSQPLGEVRIAPEIQKLDAALVSQWERQWTTRTEQFEMVGGAGKPYTATDREAATGSRLLTQEDRLPQTLFRIAATPGRPLLLMLPLRIQP